MAGGEGSRLRPITANRPKPLVPIANRPIMTHIIELLKRHGITEVVATLHYLADEIQSTYDDGSDWGIQMSYSIEDTPLGTAGSVKKAQDLIGDQTFLIISGDALTDCNLTRAIEFHRSKESVATLILARVPNPLDFGVVITDGSDRVERFLEKPSWSEVFSDTVNTGIYILEPEVFDLMEPGKQYDWSHDVFPELLRLGKALYGFVMDEYWCDIGSLVQYRDAQEHVLSGATSLPMDAEEIRPGIWTGPNCVIDDQATLVPPVCLGRNVKIKRNARVGPYSVVGDYSLIEEGANVERSVLWDSAYIGANVGVHSATICSRVTLKRDTVVREDAVIGDRCLVDVECMIRPRIKLWPDKIIERGSTVTMSLVWGNKWRGSLFRELGVAGLSNIEITPDYATRLGSAFGSTLPARSKVVTSRDSTRSSRMIKRAIIASLLSVGCDVLDMRSSAVPIMRHFIKASGAAGAVNVRKLPGNSRVTLIEMFDKTGGYLTKSHERKVETAFFREDFQRTDPDDLGVIEFAGRAIEEYQHDFFSLLATVGHSKRIRVVCDYGYSALSPIFPAMLAKLGVESISLNAFNDAKLAPRSRQEIGAHIENLRQIVSSLGYDMGVLFTDEGERLTLVNNDGKVVEGHALFASFCVLVAKTHPGAHIAMSVTAPQSLESILEKDGANVIRTKADTRSLMSSGQTSEITFAGDDRGGFIFPEFHPGFDAMFGLGKLVLMLQQTGLTISEVSSELPEFHMFHEHVKCPWEQKGAVMRRLAEAHPNEDQVELIDGLKFFKDDSWVLVLPDAVEPVFHIYAESTRSEEGQDLVEQYVKEIDSLQHQE